MVNENPLSLKRNIGPFRRSLIRKVGKGSEGRPVN